MKSTPATSAFLFSRNRLNVAISRAGCLAVGYASPRLLEVPCSTLEQMLLDHGLCWARARSEETRGAEVGGSALTDERGSSALLSSAS